MLKSLRILVLILLVITTLCIYYTYLYPFSISKGNTSNGVPSLTIKSIGLIPTDSWSTNEEISTTTKESNVNKILSLKTENMTSDTTEIPALRSPSEVLKEGDGIIFLESTDRMELPTLVLCAVESAARIYKDRPVALFLKGLNDTNNEELVRRRFPTLSSLSNIYFFPLKFDDVFAETPLHAWYMKINPQQESHWTHVSSDGCRLALVWKYGGIYMDTDVISIRTIPKKDFLAAQDSYSSSNGVFGFSPHHNFTQKCMEDYVQKYNSRIWGNQGPVLFSRVIKGFCNMTTFNDAADTMCGNITIFNPQRFYPIFYPSWRRYYQVWDKIPTFNTSYGLHLWNYMNHEKLTVVPGSNVLAEHLYKEYCPSTYEDILKNETAIH